MSLAIVVDMDLSPDWARLLCDRGWLATRTRLSGPAASPLLWASYIPFVLAPELIRLLGR
jgi:hypothetical protein